jgi:hygromycin-B 7''-O-kinase
MQLPSAIDPEYFDVTYRTTPGAWRAAVVELCAAHALACDEVRAFADGSNLVAAVDARCVVKIFPPFHQHQWESERRALPRLHARLPIDVPGLIAQGVRDDGWPYLIVELLPGVSLDACWPSLDHANKARVLVQIGEAMAAAHALPVEDLITLAPDWNAFIRVQAADCKTRHARHGLPDRLIDGIDALVGDGSAFETSASARVILTGEYTPFNLLAQRDTSGFRLSGMIDLGDAMIGPREYDLLGPSLFLAEGDAVLIGSFLRGYYGRAHQLDRSARMHLLTLALLHRYSNLDKQIRIPDWRARASSLEDVALLLWPDAK